MSVEWRRRTWQDAVARRPGGKAFLTRRLLLEREREVRAAIEATSDESERQRLSATADELRQLANGVEAEAKEYDMTTTAEQIRKKAQARLRNIAQRMAALPAVDPEVGDVAYTDGGARVLRE